VIARLRRRHRIWTVALAVLLPPAFAGALASRSASPPSGAIPPPLIETPTNGTPLWTRDDLWSALPVRTRGFAAPDGIGMLVEVAPLRDPMLPDVLVYWAERGTPERLPDGAHLLGRLAGAASRHFAVPAAATAEPGWLYLYSLGHARLVGSAALPSGGE
jgi:hypothetical protein